MEMSIKSASFDLAWHPAARVVTMTTAPGVTLTAEDGVVLVSALEGWVGADTKPFALLVDAAGVLKAGPEFRATAFEFFAKNRDRAFIAPYNLGPLVRVTAEMFRVGARVRLKAFADEAGARAWLRENGIDA